MKKILAVLFIATSLQAGGNGTWYYDVVPNFLEKINLSANDIYAEKICIEFEKIINNVGTDQAKIDKLQQEGRLFILDVFRHFYTMALMINVDYGSTCALILQQQKDNNIEEVEKFNAIDLFKENIEESLYNTAQNINSFLKKEQKKLPLLSPLIKQIDSIIKEQLQEALANPWNSLQPQELTPDDLKEIIKDRKETINAYIGKLGALKVKDFRKCLDRILEPYSQASYFEQALKSFKENDKSFLSQISAHIGFYITFFLAL
ncbi:MAG: hypothetical protein AB7E68_05305 [Candidatus Babeliales bacterium]